MQPLHPKHVMAIWRRNYSNTRNRISYSTFKTQSTVVMSGWKTIYQNTSKVWFTIYHTHPLSDSPFHHTHPFSVRTRGGWGVGGRRRRGRRRGGGGGGGRSEMERQKLDKQNSRQLEQHTKAIFWLTPGLTRERLTSLDSQQNGHGKEEDKWRRRHANTKQWLLKLKLFFPALWIYLLFEVFLGLFRIWNDLQTDKNKLPLYITAK